MATVRGWEKFCHFHAYTCITTVMYYMLYHICLVGLIHTVICHLLPPLESRWTSLLLLILLIHYLNFTWSKNILDVCGETISCAGGCFSELPNFSKDYDIGRGFNLFRFIFRVFYTALLYLPNLSIHLIINCQLMNYYWENFSPLNFKHFIYGIMSFICGIM